MRKNKAKKGIAVLLASVLLLVFLSFVAGCSAPKKIKISVGIWPDKAASSAEEQSLWTEWKERFERDYPQYEIVSQPYSYNANTVLAKVASGQLPTIFKMDASEAEEASANGYIRNVKSELQKFGWYDKIADDVLQEIETEQTVYGVPCERYAAGMVLNLPLLYEIGVIEKNEDGTYRLYQDGEPLYPNTFEEITKLLKA